MRATFALKSSIGGAAAGALVVSAGADGFARVWDARLPPDRACLAHLHGGGEVTAASFSPGGRYLQVRQPYNPTTLKP
eukprot:1178892-Prorocentrum_minimum.AAC.8